jgi:hypothetical protein
MSVVYIHCTHVCCIYTLHTCVLDIYTAHMCVVYIYTTHMCVVHIHSTKQVKKKKKSKCLLQLLLGEFCLRQLGGSFPAREPIVDQVRVEESHLVADA